MTADIRENLDRTNDKDVCQPALRVGRLRELGWAATFLASALRPLHLRARPGGRRRQLAAPQPDQSDGGHRPRPDGPPALRPRPGAAVSGADPFVHVEEGDGVTTVVLDDPGRRNALSWDLVRPLIAAVEGAVAAGSRALVLTNTPPVFSAGGSVDDLLEPKVPLEETYRAFRALDEAPIPTVAAVNGAAVGAGLNLFLACDVALCTPESRFDVRFLDVGIHPGGGSMWRLARAMGRQGAAALALFGEVLDGEEAVRRGLVWKCVPADELAGEAARLARRAAATRPRAGGRGQADAHCGSGSLRRRRGDRPRVRAATLVDGASGLRRVAARAPGAARPCRVTGGGGDPVRGGCRPPRVARRTV